MSHPDHRTPPQSTIIHNPYSKRSNKRAPQQQQPQRIQAIPTPQSNFHPSSRQPTNYHATRSPPATHTPTHLSSSTQSTASSTMAAILNPYASKRTPIHETDNKGGLSSTVIPFSAAASTKLSANKNLNGFLPPIMSDTNVTINSYHSVAKQIHWNGNGTEPASLVAAPSASKYLQNSAVPSRTSKESYLHRLPSQKISFGSAEILTVSEFLEHAAKYCGRSVRITGKLQGRTGLDDDGTQLQLVDPLVLSQINKACNTISNSSLPTITMTPTSLGKRKLPPQPVSSLKTPSNSSNKRAALRTPAASLPSMRTPAASLRSTSSSNIKRYQNPILQSRVKGSGGIGLLRGVRTKLSANKSITTPHSADQVQNVATSQHTPKMAEPQPPDSQPTEAETVIVRVDPGHLSNLSTVSNGDLVMVIGMVEKCKEDIGNDTTTDETQPINYYLKARVLNNVSLTNMGLHSKSLKQRRSLLLRQIICKRQQTQTQDGHSNGQNNLDLSQWIGPTELLQGCGPPPYEIVKK